MSWHIDEPTWRAYAAGGLATAAEAAVETHVTACPDCREGARTLMPDPEPLWQAVHAEITTPRLSLALRVLARLGVPADDLVVLAAGRDLGEQVGVGGLRRLHAPTVAAGRAIGSRLGRCCRPKPSNSSYPPSSTVGRWCRRSFRTTYDHPAERAAA